MIRAALFAIALVTAPASAATVNDLTMTVIDGRPVFRPADDLDCFDAKYGGSVTDCVEVDGLSAPLFLQIGMSDREVLAAVFNGHEIPPPPVPLPAPGLMLLAAMAVMMWKRRT